MTQHRTVESRAKQHSQIRIDVVSPGGQRSGQCSESLGVEHRPTAFLSYSHADAGFARPLGQALTARGVGVWVDYVDLRTGDSLIESISNAIAQGDFVVVIVSPSFVDSEWCRVETRLAMTEGIARKSVVVLPVRIRNATMPAYLTDTKWLEVAEGTDIAYVADQLASDIQAHLQRAPIADKDWLISAIQMFEAQTPEAQERWMHHLEGAIRTRHMDTPIDGGPHYQTVKLLCHMGALAETGPGRRFVHFEITDRGRLLFRTLER